MIAQQRLNALGISSPSSNTSASNGFKGTVAMQPVPVPSAPPISQSHDITALVVSNNYYYY